MVKKEEIKPQFRVTWKLVMIVLSVLILIVFFAFYFGLIKKTCEDDVCFNVALNKCGMARYLKIQNFNFYEYSIEGSKGNDCQIHIELVKMAIGTPKEKIDKFEGKDMRCLVPKSQLGQLETANIDNILDHCSGPLKEAMYEQIIEKLYTLIVSNMGDILVEIEDAMAPQI